MQARAKRLGYLKASGELLPQLLCYLVDIQKWDLVNIIRDQYVYVAEHGTYSVVFESPMFAIVEDGECIPQYSVSFTREVIEIDAIKVVNSIEHLGDLRFMNVELA